MDPNVEIRMNLNVPTELEEWNRLGKDCLPEYMGLELLSVEADAVHARMHIRKEHHAPNGFLHAASVVALADTACGYATFRNLPGGARGFTTLELKANFIGTALEGSLDCIATPVHRGRSTQVWDAQVKASASGKTIALFRCTQMILWPKAKDQEQK
jgi:uncharacterized protein (TIGR00369 family)